MSYFQQRAKELGIDLPESGPSQPGDSYFTKRARELGVSLTPTSAPESKSDFFTQRSMELGLTPRPQSNVTFDGPNLINVRQSPLAQEAAAYAASLPPAPEMPPDNRNEVQKTLDYIFKENPVSRVLNRPFAAAAAASVPDAPMMDRQGNIPGTSAREEFLKKNPMLSTGNETVDKVSDIAGNIGSYFLNPAGAGQGPIALYKAAEAAAAKYLPKVTEKVVEKLPNAGLTLSKDGTKLVESLASKGVREGAKEAAVAATYAVPRSLIEGESDPLEIAQNVAIEGSLGAATGFAAPFIGSAFRRTKDALTKKATDPEIPTSAYESAAGSRSLSQSDFSIPQESSDAAMRMDAPIQPRNASSVTTELPEGIQAMRSELIPMREPNPNAIIDKPITRQELLNNVRKRLGVTVRTGRLGVNDDSVLGYYKINPEVVRSRQHGDIQVISHEVGHHLDKKHGLSNPQYDNELIPLGRSTSGPGYTTDQVRNEGLAEFMRLYLTDPDTARKIAPSFYEQFEKAIPSKTLKALSSIQKDVATWIDQGPEMQFRGQISRSGRDNSKTVSQRINDIYTDFMDKFHPLAMVEKEANRALTGKAVLGDASNSLYKRARLSVGAPKKAHEMLNEMQAILKPLDDFGYKMKDLGDYAAAKHALELEKQGIESGFTQKQIEAVLKKYDTPEMNAMQRQLVDYNNKLLDMLVEGQVLSREAVETMRFKHPEYVPFYRFFDDDMAFGFGGRGFTDLTSPVKRMKGSTRDIIDPLESMIKNTFAAVNAIEKNKVGLELAKLAEVPGMGRFVERLSGKQSAPKENIVTVWENGEKVQYQLDPDLYKAIKQLDEDSTNKLIKLLSYPSSMLRAGATLTPEFALRNPIRDQFQAYVVSEFGYNPIIDLPRGMFHVLRHRFSKNGDELYKQWVNEGGAYGNYLSQDRNYLREQLKQLKDERNPWAKATTAIVSPKQWLKLMQAISEVTEEATKVGEFRKGLKKGYTPAEAAYQSRDLMDFGRVGNNIKQLNKVVAFFNANIQGKDRIARAFKKHPVRSTVRALTSITLPTIGIYLWNKNQANDQQRKTLDNAPQWMRDTFFLIAIPGTDVVARIPKPFDLSPIYANLPEHILRWMDNNDPQSAAEFTKGAAEDMLGVPYMLTGLTPIIENLTNYSFFTKGPVVPRRDQDLLPEDQYGVNTSLTARTLGKLTGTSPYKIDNLIRGYGAGLGKYATSGIDKILEATGVGDLPPAAQKHWYEQPVANAFFVSPSGGGKVMEDFYEQLDKVNRKDKSNKRNEISDKDVAQTAKGMSRASKSISEIRNRYRLIQADMKMSPEEKRKQLDALDDQMNKIAREALERFEFPKK